MSVNAESPTSNSPPTSPHPHLQHFTSSPNLSPNPRIASSNRNSQLIPRSPASIPSSPTSVHSSSSAIFERDIEPISTSPSHHHHPADPHRIARGHNSETLEHSVPSVLDSAAEILTSTSSPSGVPAGDEEEISIIAPNPAYAIGSSSTSPMSTSRSPSPGAGLRSNRVPMLLNLPNILPGTSQLGAVSLPPPLSPPMATAVSNTEPLGFPEKSISTPTSAYYSLTSSTSSSPTTTTLETHPLRTGTLPHAERVPSPNLSPRLRSSTSGSPNVNASSKRLSFLSYTDLLASTPSSTLPLSSFTTALSTNQPEPPSRSLFVEPDVDVDPEKSFESTQIPLRGRSSGLDGSSNGLSGSMSLVTAEGGEWEREGLGRGLEERLEMVVAAASNASSPVGIPVAAGGPGV